MRMSRLLRHRRDISRIRKTRRHHRHIVKLVAAGIVGSSPWASADITTTLTGLGDTNVNVPANHGSTAETTLTWDTLWDQHADWDGRGDVYQLDEFTPTIVFVPTSANIRLSIDEFFLDEWAGGGDTSSMWAVSGSVSGLLSSGTWVDFNNANDPNDQGGRSSIQPGAVGQPGETLTLAFDHSAGGFVSYLAMDNLTYSSVVIPEPATSTLAFLSIGGLGALAMRRKKKR